MRGIDSCTHCKEIRFRTQRPVPSFIRPGGCEISAFGGPVAWGRGQKKTPAPWCRGDFLYRYGLPVRPTSPARGLNLVSRGVVIMSERPSVGAIQRSVLPPLRRLPLAGIVPILYTFYFRKLLR